MSFWDTDLGSSMLSRKSTLMTKIEDKTTKLEQVLDEDDLLQQCSNKNQTLIEFLSRPDMVRRVIEYITFPVEENVAKYAKEFDIELDPNDIEPPSFGVTVEQIQEEEKTSDSEPSRSQDGDASSSSSDDEENSLSVSSASAISSIPEDEPTDAMDVDDDTPPDPVVATTTDEIADGLANLEISSSDNAESKEQPAASSEPPKENEESSATTVVVNGHADDESKEQKEEESTTQPRREVPQETKDLLERIRVKYPYLCSEILASQLGAVLDCIMNESHGFLDLLFEHIRREPPLDAVLTNYWRTAVVALTRRSPETIIGYFRANSDILDRLIQHISDQSIMELVITLGWDPLIEELTADLDDIANWMREEDLIPKLIRMMSPICTPKDHSAASYTLVDIVAKSQRCTNLTLFEHLSSGDQVRNLMDAIFVDDESSMLESLSVLIALLHHYPNLRAEKQMQLERERLGVSGNAKGNQDDDSSSDEEDGDDDETADSDGSDDDINVDYAEPDVNDQKKKRKKKKKKKKGEDEEEAIPDVIVAVLERMDDFKRLLLTPPARKLDMSMGMLDPPLGPVRLKVVDLLVAVMRTPHPPMAEAFRRENIVGVCLNLFFEYPWNNLLHGSVEHIIQMTLSGSSRILKEALFEDNSFLQKILGARERSLAHESETGLRLGFTGHLTRISNTVVEFGKRDEYLDSQIKGNDNWQEFMTGGLRQENDKLNVQLGGHRPAQLDDDIMFHIDLGDKETTGKILEDLEMNMKADDEYRMPGDEDLSNFAGGDSDEDEDASPATGNDAAADNAANKEANGKNVDVDAFGSWPFGGDNATVSRPNDDDGPHSSDEEDNAEDSNPQANADPFDFDADFEFAESQPQQSESQEQPAVEKPEEQQPPAAESQPAASGGDPFADWEGDPFAGFDDASNAKGQETESTN